MEEKEPTAPVELAPVEEKAVSKTPSRAQIEKLKDQKARENAPEILDKFYSAVKKRLDAGDSSIIPLVAKMLGAVQDKPLVSVNNNTQVNVSSGGKFRDRGFENVVRTLDERDQREREAREGRQVIDVRTVDSTG